MPPIKVAPSSSKQAFLSLDHQDLTNLPSEYFKDPHALSGYEILWLNHNNIALESFPQVLRLLSSQRHLKWFSFIQGGSFWPGFSENHLKYELYRLYVLHFWWYGNDAAGANQSISKSAPHTPSLKTLDSKKISKEEWKQVQNHSEEEFTEEICELCNEVIWVNSLHWKICPSRKRACAMYRYGCSTKGTEEEILKHQELDCAYYKVRHLLRRMEAKIAHLEQELIDVTMKHHPIRLVTPKCLVLIPSRQVRQLESVRCGELLEETMSVVERQSMSSLHSLYSGNGAKGANNQLVYKVLKCREHESDGFDDGDGSDEESTLATTRNTDEDSERGQKHRSRSGSVSSQPDSSFSSLDHSLRDLVMYTPILTKNQITRLHPKFPVRFQNCDFVLIHTNTIHGTSLLHAIQRCRTCEPILIVIRTMKNEVFGAYCSGEWREAWKQYYGSGETFLWTFEPDLKVYKWTKINSYFQYSNKKYIALGGGSSFGKGYGLKINGGLMDGVTLSSETFGNDPLVPSQQFQIANIEFWSFKVRK